MTTDQRIAALERAVKGQDGDLERLMDLFKNFLEMERQQNAVARDLRTTLEIIVRQVASLSDRVKGDNL